MVNIERLILFKYIGKGEQCPSATISKQSNWIMPIFFNDISFWLAMPTLYTSRDQYTGHELWSPLLNFNHSVNLIQF